jgi:hypothetical protein
MMDAHSLNVPFKKFKPCRWRTNPLHRHKISPTEFKINLVANPNPPSFPTCVVILMVRGNWQKRVETAQG